MPAAPLLLLAALGCALPPDGDRSRARLPADGAFVDLDAQATPALEIVRLLGALHAPACGPDSPDPDVPDPDVAFRIETLDPLDGEWLPADSLDLMGCCREAAVSPCTSTRIRAGLLRAAP